MPTTRYWTVALRLSTDLVCSATLSPNTVQGFEKNVTLDGDLQAATVWPEPLQRDQLTREQGLYILAVHLRWDSAAIY